MLLSEEMQSWINFSPCSIRKTVHVCCPDEGRVNGNMFICHTYLLSFPIKLHISAQGHFSLF